MDSVQNMNDKDFFMARRVAEAVDATGGRTFYVGGFVRDRLLHQPNTDIDIEVHGVSPEVLEGILDSLGGCTKKGISFGIYGLAGCTLDIAMPRREEATGRGHRDFQVYVDPYLGTEKAARRRDFTMNAMMENVLTGQIVDHFGGWHDLREGVLRHVDDETFGEDPLRVLRAAQFAARFGLKIHPETLEICRNMDLTALAPERVMGELEKALLQADRPSVFFETLREMDQLEDWFPELAALIGVEQSPLHHPEGDVWNHTMLVLDQAAELRGGTNYPGLSGTGMLTPSSELGFMLAALCHDFGKDVTTAAGEDGRIHALGHESAGVELADQFIRRLTTNRKLRQYVRNMTELHMKPNILAGAQAKVKSTNKLFDQAEDPEGLILLGRADHLGRTDAEINHAYEEFLWERLQIYREAMARPYVQGSDLIEAGLMPGPQFSEVLAYAHKLRLAGVEKENALKQTLAFARKCGR